MPHDMSELGTPEEWLKRAKSNLALAKQPRTEEIYLETCALKSSKRLKQKRNGVAPTLFTPTASL